MRFGYATVALPSLTPEAACAALAEAGFEGVEWKVGDAPHAGASNAPAFLSGNICTLPPTIEATARSAQIAAEYGLEVIGLAPYVVSGDEAAFRHMVRLAVAARAPQIRLQAPRLGRDDGYRELRDSFAAFVRWAARIAAPAGVRVVLELHHRTIMPSVGLAMPILDGSDPAEVGIIYDAGNLVYEGYEDHRIGLELLGEHLHHVHIKNVSAARGPDGRWDYQWSLLDDGLVDVQGILQHLHGHGYRGWVSVEDLAPHTDSASAITYNAATLSRLDPPGWRTHELTSSPRHHDA